MPWQISMRAADSSPSEPLATTARQFDPLFKPPIFHSEFPHIHRPVSLHFAFPHAMLTVERTAMAGQKIMAIAATPVLITAVSARPFRPERRRYTPGRSSPFLATRLPASLKEAHQPLLF